VKILLFSKYGELGASSRLRSYQFLPLLEKAGIHVERRLLFDDLYLNRRYDGSWLVVGPLISAYFRRFRQVLSRGDHDAVWVEKELFPWLPQFMDTYVLPRSLPVVVDYDDAIFHKYDRHSNPLVRALLGKKIDGIMRRASTVNVGNEYIAARARAAGAKKIRVIPTSIDTSRYSVRTSVRSGSPFSIGWIGTPYTSRYLREIAPALRALVNTGRVKIVLIGGPSDADLGFEFEALQWTEETEIESLQTLDCGIMPLPDNPFERGKCGYKLLQYMGCGLPVVASPVGVNSQIVHAGRNGFLANTEEEWVESLLYLAANRESAASMGRSGRRLVEESYSSSRAASDLADVFHSLRCEKA